MSYMASKRISYPWPTLTQKAGYLRGLTTLLSNDPTVGLSWLSFHMANHPSQQGYEALLLSASNLDSQNHKFLTLRGIRRQDPKSENIAVFQESGAKLTAPLTCVSIDPLSSSLLNNLEVQIRTKSADVVIIDLEYGTFKPFDMLNIYHRLSEISLAMDVPVVVATRGPSKGEEITYMNALSVFSSTEIWVRRGPLMLPPDGKTVNVQAFRQGNLLCMFGLRANDELGDFSELTKSR